MKYIITFILGVIISGIAVWNITTRSSERAIELLVTTSETASLEFYIKLQKVPDSEIKCKLAKHSVSIANSLDADAALRSPLLGPPGLGLVTSNFITETLEKYEAENIFELANTCASQAKLYQ